MSSNKLDAVGFDDPGKTIGKFDSVKIETSKFKPTVMQQTRPRYTFDHPEPCTMIIHPTIKLPPKTEKGYVFNFSCKCSGNHDINWTQISIGPCSQILATCWNCGSEISYNVVEE